ncbi:hypothetical protein [Streptomyces tropicalis]|uniref:Secreted protein n=1 Tax=Streptomyces tropicalis TaxID=3034234 RepID=A0ABT6AED2_9ACTN|nr:hypothetical protein [Streptomyces tropicalis]MDF3303010.1 hypothetical protein [Streptomyces tropicalis]
MGSLRNPVGPLPSSIYWRRRVVMLSVLALLALLIAWMVLSGGGGGRNEGGGSNGKNPAPSTITPGPTGSGPAISQHPGGRDESGGSDAGSGGTGSGGGSGAGGSGGSGAGSGGSAGGSDVGAAGSGGAGDILPADTTLPNCTSRSVKLTLRSVHNSYGPGAKPTFELTAENSAGGDCKVDLGPKSAVVTISRSDAGGDYWSSADCPKPDGSLLYRVPAGSGIADKVVWDRRPSAPHCATPPAGSAGPGTYLVEAQIPGFPKLQTSFVLSAD